MTLSDLYNNGKNININNKWVGELFMTEAEGPSHKGSILSGHRSSMYLSNSFGTWFDKNGNEIEGYLYYQPAVDRN